MATKILPVPHILQREQGECLVACAAMMLYYLGHSPNYDQLLKLLQVRTTIGAPASNIRRLGTTSITVIYKQGSWVELQEHLENNHPCMVLVQTGELPYWDEASNHVVLVVGLDDEFVYINDPAFTDAPIPVSRGDFDLAWLEKDETYAVLIPQGPVESTVHL